MPMKIFLTGGTGFIGKSLARALLARGHELRLLARPESNTVGLEGCTFIQGDLDDVAALHFAMQECEIVFHMAALVGGRAPDRTLYYRTNVSGLKNVVEAARQCGVAKTIYTSSFIALGPTDATVVTEESPPAPIDFRGEYERSQVQAERLARRYQQSGFPLVCLYPTFVYGPGEWTRGNWLCQALVRLAKMPVVLLLGSGIQNWNYAYVDDVVDGHVGAMERAAPGSRYLLGGDNRTMRDFLELAASFLGKRPPRLRLPLALAGAAARLIEIYSAWKRRSSWVNPALIELCRHDWTYSSAPAERDLQYYHRRLEVGLEETIRWLKNQGMLKV